MGPPPVNEEAAICRLCGGAAAPLHRGPVRSFFSCAVCAYIQAQESSIPSLEEARRRYDRHQNNPANPGYRAFLSRLTGPLAKRLKPGSSGLDYGCGPGPTLSVLLGEAGHAVADYDPLYRPDRSLLERRYDFVACTETAEHFARPIEDWGRMFALLKPGGILAAMTQLHDAADFTRWHYKEDPTHVGFYGRATLEWLARRFGASLAILPHSVALFLSPP